MAGFSRTKALIGAAVLSCSLYVPAVAQDYYGPRERYQDDLDRPSELDGLALGREAPFLNSEDVGVPRSRRGTFEIEAPPIAPSLPVLPEEPD
jgi:hypothetical protein